MTYLKNKDITGSSFSEFCHVLGLLTQEFRAPEKVQPVTKKVLQVTKLFFGWKTAKFGDKSPNKSWVVHILANHKTRIFHFDLVYF